jgi:hypothetical protein
MQFNSPSYSPIPGQELPFPEAPSLAVASSIIIITLFPSPGSLYISLLKVKFYVCTKSSEFL